MVTSSFSVANILNSLTPSVAILLQLGLATALLLVVNSLRRNHLPVPFFRVAFLHDYQQLDLRVLWPRTRGQPAQDKVWGYPAVPVLFVMASAILPHYTFTDNLLNSAMGSLVILAGIPVSRLS